MAYWLRWWFSLGELGSVLPSLTVRNPWCIWRGCTNWQVHPRFDLFSAVTSQTVKIKLAGNDGGTNHNHSTQTIIILRALMHPHHTPKTMSVWPTLWVHIADLNKMGMNRHFWANWALQPMGCLFFLF